MDFSTRLDKIAARHATYDKPTNKELQDIGILEYYWQIFFSHALAREGWEKSAVDLKNIIQERCVNNFEKRHTLTLLNETVIHLGFGKNDFSIERLLILVEGIKDWARKSIVRGEDIQ